MTLSSITFSQAIEAQLASSGSLPAAEVERLSKLALQLEHRQVSLVSLDSGDLILLADLLTAQPAPDAALAEWIESLDEEYRRRVHTRSHC